MRALVTLALLIAVPALAAKTHKHEAHVHGAGEVGVAFDKEKGKIDFKSAADSVVGFEHVAKSEKDKQRQAEALKKLEENIVAMVAFDSALGCKITKDELGVTQQGKHAEVKGVFSVECSKPVLGSTITFDFRKTFPGLKDVQVLLLVDGVQKEVDVEKSGVKVEVK